MAGVLRFPGGVIAHFDSGLAMPYRRELEVVGSSGVLRVADPWLPQPDGIELWRDGAGAAEVIPMAAAGAYALEVADLGAASRGEAGAAARPRRRARTGAHARGAVRRGRGRQLSQSLIAPARRHRRRGRDGSLGSASVSGPLV